MAERSVSMECDEHGVVRGLKRSASSLGFLIILLFLLFCAAFMPFGILLAPLIPIVIVFWLARCVSVSFFEAPRCSVCGRKGQAAATSVLVAVDSAIANSAKARREAEHPRGSSEPPTLKKPGRLTRWWESLDSQTRMAMTLFVVLIAFIASLFIMATK